MWSHLVEENALRTDRRLVVRTHDVEVPSGLDWIGLTASFSGTTLVNLFLVDSDGATRIQYWGLRSGERLLLRSDATPRLDGLWPGAVPGPLPGGRWRLLVAAMAVPGAASSYRVEMDGDAGNAPLSVGVETRPVAWISRASTPGQEAYDRFDWDRVRESGARWYRGDLHLHTLLSDGRLSADLLSHLALDRGLDFVVITEHNTLTTSWCETPLLVIPGVEFTSTRGHWNSLGTHAFPPLWHDDRPALESNEGMQAVLRQQGETGALVSLNHPMLPPWAWLWDETPMDLFDTIEVQNDPTYPDNDQATEAALGVWDRLWQRGCRIWGVGGGDVHFLPGEGHVPGGPPQRIGDPLTCVFAADLSPRGILAAIRRGRVYVTRGPVLDPCVQAGDGEYLPGDEIPDTAHPLRLRVTIEDEPLGGRLRWLANGREAASQALTGARMYEWTLAPEPGVYRWLRLEVRDAQGRLCAFTNPVSTGPRPVGTATRWRDVVRPGAD